MADDIDRAAARCEELLQDALSAHRRRANRSVSAVAGEDCTSCGEEIPPARRLAVPGALRCVRCQTKFERK
jgi:phage/conjugal plasmid C-4 type zinc finger TraR family protein